MLSLCVTEDNPSHVTAKKWQFKIFYLDFITLGRTLQCKNPDVLMHKNPTLLHTPSQVNYLDKMFVVKQQIIEEWQMSYTEVSISLWCSMVCCDS